MSLSIFFMIVIEKKRSKTHISWLGITFSSDSAQDTLQCALKEVIYTPNEATKDLLSEKSKELYNEKYNLFMENASKQFYWKGIIGGFSWRI